MNCTCGIDRGRFHGRTCRLLTSRDDQALSADHLAPVVPLPPRADQGRRRRSADRAS